jgi:hypothetical protein
LIETDLAGLAGGREGIYSAGDSLFTTGYEISGPLEAFTTPIDGKGVLYQRKAVEDRDSGKERFFDLRFSKNNFISGQLECPFQNLLTRGSGVGLESILKSES